MSSTDTLVIGAGPYGLSLAAHLKAAGLPFEIVGRAMGTWSDRMPPGMLLRSEAFASSLHAPRPGLTIADYCRRARIDYRPVGMRLQLSTFIGYARWFQDEAVGPVRERRVVRLAREAGGFRALFDDGDGVFAARVVLATGMQDFAAIPGVLQGLPAPQVLHSSQVGPLGEFIGKDVAIVGGGQSALGLAALLREQGTRVRVLVRGAAITWNGVPEVSRGALSHLLAPEAGLGPGWRSHLLSEYPWLFRMLPLERRRQMVARSWGPSGAWWLRDRVVEKVQLHLRHQVESAGVLGPQVRLVAGDGASRRTFACDHVIAATGFKVDINRLGFLGADIRAALTASGPAPELDRDFCSAIPGLHVLGQASAQSFGPAMRFIYGGKYAVPCVARHLLATAQTEVRRPARAAARRPVRAG